MFGLRNGRSSDRQPSGLGKGGADKRPPGRSTALNSLLRLSGRPRVWSRGQPLIGGLLRATPPSVESGEGQVSRQMANHLGRRAEGGGGCVPSGEPSAGEERSSPPPAASQTGIMAHGPALVRAHTSATRRLALQLAASQWKSQPGGTSSQEGSFPAASQMGIRGTTPRLAK